MKKWQKFVIYCVLAVGVLAFGLWTGITQLGWFDNSVAIATAPTDNEIVSEMSKNLTEQLINDAIAYKNADDNNRETALSILHQTATRRQEYIKVLMKEDPDEFLRLAITPDIKQELLQEVNDVETTVTLEGKLEIIASDIVNEDYEYLESTTDFLLILPSGKTKNLYLPESVPATYNPNDQIKVTGYELDDAIVPDTVADPENFTVTEVAELRPAIGTHNTAVILVNVENSTIPDSFTKPNALQLLDIVNNWFDEASYSQLQFVGKLNPSQSADIFGIYNIMYDNPQTTSCRDYNTGWWNTRARAAAAAADNFTADGYRHIITIINNCNFAVATAANQEVLLGSTGTTYLGATIRNTAGTAIHELGHNLHLAHAFRAHSCQIDGQPVVFSKATNCTIATYGDYFSPMGPTGNTYGNPVPHYNAIEKQYLGWIPAANVTTVTASGTYDLYASESAQVGTQLIRIPVTYDDLIPAGYGNAPFYYYLELRNPIGLESAAYRKANFTGVQLRIGRSTANFPINFLYQLGDLSGAEPCTECITGLRPGMVFKDPHDPNITIRVLSLAPDKATLNIEFSGQPPACARHNPSVSVSPNKGTTSPGGTVNYTITVANEDSHWGCPTSTLTVTSTMVGTSKPGIRDFVISPDSKSWTLAPGESGTQIFSATSPGNIADDQYTMQFIATNSDTGYTSTSHATFVVADTGATPPTINVSGIANGGTINPSTNTKITATTTHAAGISKVEIFINNKLVARCNEPKNGICDVFVKGSNTATGTHMVRVVSTAKDTSQTTGTSSLTFKR